MRTQNKKAVLIGALIGAIFSTPLLAAEEACLQNNRLWGWQAIDQRTLVVTDRTYKKFMVHLTGGCIQLNNYAGASISFRAKTNLGCIRQGDMVAFSSPGLGRMSCFITGVDSIVTAAPG